MMTSSGREQGCLFFTKKDKTFSQRQKIYESDTFKIYNSESKYFHASPNLEGGGNAILAASL